MFKFDMDVVLISGTGVGFFGLLAWLFRRWQVRSQSGWSAVAAACMLVCGLAALLCGICGVAIMADGGIRIQ